MAEYSPADEKNVREAKDRERADAEQLDADWKACLDSCAFRNILWSILVDAGIYRSSFTGNSETFFREGMRNLGLKIQAKAIEANVEAYQLMEREQRMKRTPNV
jgi:hypothetical protein